MEMTEHTGHGNVLDFERYKYWDLADCISNSAVLEYFHLLSLNMGSPLLKQLGTDPRIGTWRSPQTLRHLVSTDVEHFLQV